METLNFSPSLRTRSASIWERIIFVGAGVVSAGFVGVAAAGLLGPALSLLRNERRFDPSPFFRTVFMRPRNFESRFSFSAGTAGPSFAGALIFAVVAG